MDEYEQHYYEVAKWSLYRAQCWWGDPKDPWLDTEPNRIALGKHLSHIINEWTDNLARIKGAYPKE